MPLSSAPSASSNSSPQGSSFRKTTKKPPLKRSKRIRKFFSRQLTNVACWVAPHMYSMWMRFVWFTSKVTPCNQAAIRDFEPRRRGFVFAMWHQEVLISPFNFRNLRLHALASTSTMGKIVTALLESNRCSVFRGGRNRRLIIRDMISHINEHPHAAYGITVDGSRGPARVMKRGACTLARACGKPLYLVSTQTKRTLHLSTWDRFAIPMPFSEIATVAWGPYWVDPQSSNQDFAVFCEHVEEELLHLTTHVNQLLNDGKSTDAVHCDFPDGWKQSEWRDGHLGKSLGEWDLQLHQTPPWAV